MKIIDYDREDIILIHDIKIDICNLYILMIFLKKNPYFL